MPEPHSSEKGELMKLKIAIPEPLKRGLDEVRVLPGRSYAEDFKSALKLYIAIREATARGDTILVRKENEADTLLPAYTPKDTVALAKSMNIDLVKKTKTFSLYLTIPSRLKQRLEEVRVEPNESYADTVQTAIVLYVALRRMGKDGNDLLFKMKDGKLILFSPYDPQEQVGLAQYLGINLNPKM